MDEPKGDGMLERFAAWWRGDDIQTRAIDSFVDHPGLTEQILAIQGLSPRPWTPLGVREALGVPAVWRAVTLLSNLTGALTVRAYRNGAPMDDPPVVVQRPDPFQTARAFYRDTAWNLATLGEFVWVVTARDLDRQALSLVNAPPGQIQVDWSNERLGRRAYSWNGHDLDPRDVVHGTFATEAGALRGVGPLQICGAALSVAAEADAFAASYFAGGGVPPIVLVPKAPISPDDAEAIQTRWIERAVPGMPRVAAQVDVVPLAINAEQAQLTESRMANRGEVATMFGVPGHFLEYGAPGSSLTYTNLGAVGDELVRFTLAPGYLEPIEQAMSDLLTRTTVARFDVSGLLRADPATRWNIYRQAVGSADVPIASVDEVRRMEGLDPGSPELAPVPPNVSTPVVPSGP